MMSRKLPTQVNILGTMFEVVEDSLPSGDCGTTQQHLRLICIDRDMPYDAQIETLFHEITHAVLKHLGYDQLLGDEIEEALCQGMGVALSFIIGANPELSHLHIIAGGDNDEI
jgi:hypothetical protein